MIEFTHKGITYTYNTVGGKVITIFTNVISLETDPEIHEIAQAHHAERIQEKADDDYERGQR